MNSQARGTQTGAGLQTGAPQPQLHSRPVPLVRIVARGVGKSTSSTEDGRRRPRRASHAFAVFSGLTMPPADSPNYAVQKRS
jgi:hypothetical protein